MHQYPHHIGDFRGGTVNMTRLERWIYRDLIEVYYDKEQPLSLDLAALCRDIGVRTDEEKAVVASMLDYKFTKTDSGYVHDVCERVIEEYRAKADTARENGKKGGRPRKSDGNPEKPSGFSEEPSGNPEETGLQTNHKPLTNNQKPKESKAIRAPRFDAQAHLESLGVDPKIAVDWLTLRKSKRAAPTETAIGGIASEARRAGISLQSALKTACERGWQGFKAEWLAPNGRDSPAGWQSDNARTIAALTGRDLERDRDESERTIDV